MYSLPFGTFARSLAPAGNRLWIARCGRHLLFSFTLFSYVRAAPAARARAAPRAWTAASTVVRAMPMGLFSPGPVVSALLLPSIVFFLKPLPFRLLGRSAAGVTRYSALGW